MSYDQGYSANYNVSSVNKFDFYSGSQITVWFGDIMIDDISSISWQRAQNKRPIYGYASQQFDAVANGTVMIQGNFAVNFRQRGYISMVVDAIKHLYGNVTNNEAWPEVKQLIGLHLRNGTFGPQTTSEIQSIGNSPDFAELAKEYENIIWGKIETDKTIGGGVGAIMGLEDKSYSSSDILSPDVQQANLLPDGFNILITYGNPNHTSVKSLTEQLQSTTKTLVGVHLVGEAQEIQVGGQPCMEQYSFIARGTDGSLGSIR